MFTSKFIWDERKKKKKIKVDEVLFENGTLC